MDRFMRHAAIALCALAAAPVFAQTPRAVSLTAADTNRIVAVRVGRIVTVTLRQSAGTGAGWRMVPAAGLIQVGPPIVTPVRQDGTPIAGSAAMHRFRVRITAPGDLALTFVDAHGGGPDQPAETATFVIEAQ